MLGTIFSLELRQGARHGHPVLGRSLYGLLLAVETGLLFLGLHFVPEIEVLPGELVEFYLGLLITQHFVILIVSTPAYFASSLAEEHARGTLPLLLTTLTGPAEIVLGKFLARGLQILAFLAIVVPFVVVAVSLLGWSVLTVFGWFAGTTLALLFALGAVTQWVSSRQRSTRTTALLLFVWLGAFVSAAAILRWCGADQLADLTFFSEFWLPWFQVCEQVVELWNPVDLLSVWADTATSGPAAGKLAMLMLFCVVVGVAALGLCISGLRHQAIRLMAGMTRRERLGPRRPGVNEDDPIRWREQVLASSWPRWIEAILVGWAAHEGCDVLIRNDFPWLLLPAWLFGGLVVGFLLAIRGSGAISGERERQTWDSLLVTPLDTWEILLDKRWGILAAYWPVFTLGTLGGLIACAWPALVESGWDHWTTLALGVGSALASGGFVVYMVSNAILRSAEMRGSRMPLVSALGRCTGYLLAHFLIMGLVIGIGLFLVTLPIIHYVFEAIGLFYFLETYGILLLAGLASYLGWHFYQAANLRLWYAQVWIDGYERFGRTLTRSLSRALRSHYEKKERKGAGQRSGPITAQTRSASSDDAAQADEEQGDAQETEPRTAPTKPAALRG